MNKSGQKIKLEQQDMPKSKITEPQWRRPSPQMKMLSDITKMGRNSPEDGKENILSVDVSMNHRSKRKGG